MDPNVPRRGNPNMRPGQPSLNPSGRPRGAAGLSRYIAEQTSDGAELVDRLLHLSRTSPSAREQLAATMALLDRLAGKPLAPSISHVMTGPSLPERWSEMSLPERRAYLDTIDAGRR